MVVPELLVLLRVLLVLSTFHMVNPYIISDFNTSIYKIRILNFEGPTGIPES